MTAMSLPVQRIRVLMSGSSLFDSSRPTNPDFDERLLLLGLFPSSNRRVPHISLVFREMWDTTGVSLQFSSFDCPSKVKS